MKVPDDPALRVFPEEGPLDEPLGVRVEGLSPGERVSLRCRLRDEAGKEWISHGEFEAGPGGTADPAQCPSLSGTYTGLDPEGLFWSMAPEPAGPRQGKFSLHDVSPVAVELEALGRGRFLGRVPAARRIASPGLLREDVREGDLVGTLFLPPGVGPWPGVVDIVHSGGGLRHEPFAALLASRGFAVLALATFGVPPLSRGLVEIPVERLE